MHIEKAFKLKRHLAFGALIGKLLRCDMFQFVGFQMLVGRVRFSTLGADEWLTSGVGAHVSLRVGGLSKGTPTVNIRTLDPYDHFLGSHKCVVKI